MARTAYLALFLLLSALPLHAACVGRDLIDALPPDRKAAAVQAAEAQPHARGNLWRATKDGQEVVVVGTYHLSDPRHAGTLARIEPLVARAARLLVEAGPEEEAALKAAIARDPTLMFSKGATLPERLDAADWALLSGALRARGMPPFMAAKLAPWYVSVMLAIPPCAMEAAADISGLDRQVMALAAARGVPVAALEPWDAVLRLFDAMGEDEQLAMIRTTLPLEPQAADMSVTLANRYFAGESRLVWEFMRLEAQRMPGYDPDKADAEFARMEELLVASRNRAWLPAVTRAAAEEPVVVAVGALHLPGRDGLLALLERAGFAVAPLAP